MKILAIEQSTQTGSVALIENSGPTIERSWRDTRNQAPSLFHFVPEICMEAGIKLSEISLYAVGLGPGGYTGLRTSITAVMSYALPSRTGCYGISSGHILAYRIFKQSDILELTVIGDARRNHIWTGSFRSASGLPEQTGEWKVVPAEALSVNINRASTVVTSEPERLSSALAALKSAGIGLIEEPLAPSASDLGILARLMSKADIPSQPLKLIYAHPSVVKKG